MSELKDKVAAYLSSFLDLEEWKPTRDDPFGNSLVAATHSADRKVARAAKAELRDKAAAPVTGALNQDKPLGVERPKAVEPTLSRGAHTTPPEVKGVEPSGKVDKKPEIPPVKHSTDIKEPTYKPKEPQHTGGLANPHPSPRPSPELQKGLNLAAGAHIKAQVDKMFAAKETQAATKASIGNERGRSQAYMRMASDPLSAGRTKRQRYHDRQKAFRAGVKLGLNNPATPAPGMRAYSGERTGRVDTAVTNALIAATPNKEKKHLLRQQTKSPNNVTEPVNTSSSSTVDISQTTGKEKKFVSQEVLADLRAKAAKK